MTIKEIEKDAICEKENISKIEKIKISAVDVIAQRGFAKSSVADIANHANVSVGYLYRHYPSKEELIKSIIYDIYQRVLENTTNILNTSNTIDEVCEGVIKYHYTTYLNQKNRIRFLLMLVNDFAFDPDQEQKNFLYEICSTFYKKCLDKENVRKELKIEEAYIALVVIPLQSLALKIREISFSDISDEETMEQIKTLSLKIIKE